MAKTLYDKLWDEHIIEHADDGSTLIYIDRHLVHEVTSPQAFEGLELAHRPLWRKNSILAVPDHNVPTTSRLNFKNEQQAVSAISDEIARLQVSTLNDNAQKFGINKISLIDKRQGIVHVVGPEQGFTLPGLTMVCGDSHTSTHGAFGALAFGIGTSEVEHVMASQSLIMKKSKNFLARFDGTLQKGVFAKDLVLDFIGKIGTAGGTGYTIEFAGDAIKLLTMEGRMTVCNMAIEAGARSGLVAVDEITIKYLRDKVKFPSDDMAEKAFAYWQTLISDVGALFERELVINAHEIAPQVTWGTSPEMVVGVDGKIPKLNTVIEDKRRAYEQALEYMNLQPEQPINSITLNKIFIGSCTNSRIEDLRVAAQVLKGNKIAKNIDLAMVVPGSGLIKEQAEREGLAQIFINAGFEWREAGCSMCLGMNPDILNKGERCASTSNRNFEGRQGAGSRTHLVSPATAALAAIKGHFADVRGY